LTDDRLGLVLILDNAHHSFFHDNPLSLMG